MNSLFNSETLYADIGTYLYVLSKGLVGYTFVALIILFIVLDVRKKGTIVDNDETKLLIIPTAIYFVLVAKMSPYKELRYIMPIISVSMIYLIYVFSRLFELNFKQKTAKIATVALFAIITISPLFTGAHLDFTYTKMNHLADKMEEKSDIPALYVFNENNIRFLDDIYMFTKLDNSYIMKYSNANEENIRNVLSEKDTSKGLILVYNEGVQYEDIVKQIKEIYNYKTDERVQDLNAGGVLYLH